MLTFLHFYFLCLHAFQYCYSVKLWNLTLNSQCSSYLTYKQMIAQLIIMLSGSNFFIWLESHHTFLIILRATGTVLIKYDKMHRYINYCLEGRSLLYSGFPRKSRWYTILGYVEEHQFQSGSRGTEGEMWARVVIMDSTTRKNGQGRTSKLSVGYFG